MGASDAKATFSIDVGLEGRDETNAYASELEALREKIRGSTDAIKQMSAANRSLRGSTDEVKGAKAELKSRLDAERDAVSRANLALLKHGTTYEKLAEQERRAAKAKTEADAEMKASAAKMKTALEEEKKKADALAESLKLKKAEEGRARLDAMKNGVAAAGGPVEALSGKFGTLKGILGGGSAVMGATALGVAALAAAVVGFTVAVVAGTVAFAKWVLEAGNAARAMGLVREAMSGSEKNASALGSQIDLLATKVPIAKAELNALASETTRSLSGTMVSGQGIVDTFNAVAVASAAAGDSVGKTFGDIIEQGKRFGRIQLTAPQLQGSRVKFQDVAGELAKQTKVGLKEAMAALAEGRVEVNAGAAAIRAAVEKQFGAVNAKKMLDLDTIALKFHEHLADLTRGVNLEPVLRALDRLSSLFSTSTVTGSAMKTLVTTLGNVLVGGAAKGTDLVTFAIKQLVIWALKLEIAFLKSRRALMAAFENPAVILAAKAVLVGIVGTVAVLGAALAALGVVVGAAFAVLGGAFLAVGEALETIKDLATAVFDWFGSITWSELGTSIVDGIVAGITGAASSLKNAVGELATKAKDTFKNLLGIHSPSAVFAGYGQQTAEGYAQGVEGGAGRAQDAAGSLAPSAPGGGGGAGAGAGRPIQVTIQVYADSKAKGDEVAAALASPSFLGKLVLEIEKAATGAGISTQAVPG
jgi:hypothetical protein